MTLNEWVAKTPGMAQLESDITTHLESMLEMTDQSDKEGAVRCVMTSIRQTWEAK